MIKIIKIVTVTSELELNIILLKRAFNFIAAVRMNEFSPLPLHAAEDVYAGKGCANKLGYESERRKIHSWQSGFFFTGSREEKLVESKSPFTVASAISVASRFLSLFSLVSGSNET